VTDKNLLGPWIRRFLLEYLVSDRYLARNTQMSYRDTLSLLITFISNHIPRAVDCLNVIDLSADGMKAFLTYLEEDRHCGKRTRNQRLAAIHAFAYFVAEKSPEHIAWCGEIRSIRCHRYERKLIPYLEKPEIDALIEAPDRSTSQGERDHALLLFLYNSGARASEAAQLMVSDLELALRSGKQAFVCINGKGGKKRKCPLWDSTTKALQELIEKNGNSHLFLNNHKQPLTRFGVHAVVKRYARKAAAVLPSLASQKVSPHTIRHTTATHLLRSGNDINTIRAWLGHVSIDTTNIYAETDLDMKVKALAACEILDQSDQKGWKQDKSLMEFLRKLGKKEDPNKDN